MTGERGSPLCRSGLRAAWRYGHGEPRYLEVLTRGRMEEVHGMRRRDFLEGHGRARAAARPWAEVEDTLEAALQVCLI